LSGVTGIVVDALSFWLKVLLADYVLWRVADSFPQRPAWLLWAWTLCAGLGALCVLFA
jgi:hypothetical protein